MIHIMHFLPKLIVSALYAASLLIGGPSSAENYRVPASVERQVSDILGEAIEATQRLARPTSMQAMQQGGIPFVRFNIADGDIGGAPTDNDPTHSRIFDRPYSERVEIRTEDALRRDSVYEVSFQVRFVEGFYGDNETFFQIHTGQKPPLMFFFRQFGRTHLLANFMQGCTRTCGHNDQPDYVRVKEFYPASGMFGRWHQFLFLIDTSNQGEMSIYVNGQSFATNQPVTFPSQHRPYLRFGVYRSGSEDGNRTSVVDYRNLSIQRVGQAGQ